MHKVFGRGGFKGNGNRIVLQIEGFEGSADGFYTTEKLTQLIDDLNCKREGAGLNRLPYRIEADV